MHLTRDIARETIKALAVLALIFLSFAHTPITAAPAPMDMAVLSDTIFCGAGPDDEGEAPGHSPCHACRVSVADLPSPPCAIGFQYLGAVDIDFAPGEMVGVIVERPAGAGPRAPPAAV